MFQRHTILPPSGQFPEERGRIFFENVNHSQGVTPEDHNMNLHHHENLKFHKVKYSGRVV